MIITTRDILNCFKKNNKPDNLLFMPVLPPEREKYKFLFSDYRYVAAYKQEILFHVTYHKQYKLFRFFEAADVFNDDIMDLDNFMWYMKQFKSAYPQLTNYIRLQKLSRVVSDS